MGRPRSGKAKQQQEARKEGSPKDDSPQPNIGAMNINGGHTAPPSVSMSSSHSSSSLMGLDNSPVPMSCAPHETLLNMPHQSFFPGQTDFSMVPEGPTLGQLGFQLGDGSSTFDNSPTTMPGTLPFDDTSYLTNCWDNTPDSLSAGTSSFGDLSADTAAAIYMSTLMDESSSASGRDSSITSAPFAMPDTRGVCAATVLVDRTQEEQTNLHIAADQDSQACQMGAILVACEKLSEQMAATDDCGECSTRISTTLAECHAAGFIADILSDGVSHCMQALAAGQDKPQPHPPSTSQQTGAQLIRFGSYQVHLSASQELLRALVRRRLRLLQTKVDMLTDMRSGWSRPGSPGEEIRDCVLLELKTRLASQVMDVQSLDSMQEGITA